jgi:hypothetical protein
MQSHSGATMAGAFQDMLERFGLEKKILAFNADNATSNDTQTSKLATFDNTFDEVNRVRCFNHTVQLSAKELIKPFNAGMTGSSTVVDDDGGMPVLENCDSDADADAWDLDTDEDIDDNIDELDAMTDEEREEFMADTAVVREAVTKVRSGRVVIQDCSNSYLGSPTLIRHYSFYYHCIACVASNLRRP